jgi:hypothetical protein
VIDLTLVAYQLVHAPYRYKAPFPVKVRNAKFMSIYSKTGMRLGPPWLRQAAGTNPDTVALRYYPRPVASSPLVRLRINARTGISDADCIDYGLLHYLRSLPVRAVPASRLGNQLGG